MTTKTILIVDDEPTITTALNHYFRQDNYETILAHSGREAIEKLSLMPDLVVLDIMLPDMDGYQVCQHIRRQPRYTPVLMLTAKDRQQDKVLGLDIGADAYLTKPYDPQELLAQVRALFRLMKRGDSSKLTCGRLALWENEAVFKLNGQEISLTSTEFDLLTLF
ncbi:MAG: response regulator transcription factor, partial [Methylococcales bacterium]|nr:response regulator transcription factor [Methylococcales bacterium]